MVYRYHKRPFLFPPIRRTYWVSFGHGWCHVVTVCVYEVRDHYTTEPYDHAANTRGNCHFVLRQPEEANSRQTKKKPTPDIEAL